MPPEANVSFREYAAHDEAIMAEWFAGEIRELPPLSAAQSAVRDRVSALLAGHVELNEYGLVIEAPFAVRMPEEINHAREPDILVVPNDFAETVRSNYVNSHGVALVVEIIDARSRQLDAVEKFDEYERAGIPEYWLVDVERKRVLVYALDGARYQRVQPDDVGVYHSRAVRGFQFAPADFLEAGTRIP